MHETKGNYKYHQYHWTNNRDQILILHSHNRIFLQFILNWFSVLCARKDSTTQSGEAVVKSYIPNPIKSMLKYALTHEISCMCSSLFDQKKKKTNYHPIFLEYLPQKVIWSTGIICILSSKSCNQTCFLRTFNTKIPCKQTWHEMKHEMIIFL